MLSGSSGWTKSAPPKTPAATSRIAPSARPWRPTTRWSAAATRSFIGPSPEAESRTRDQAELEARAPRERGRQQACADELGKGARAQTQRQLARLEPDRDV